MLSLSLRIGIVFAFICTVQISFSQQSTVSSGGSFSDTGGSISFSVGQIVYTTIDDTGGSLSQGVQQTYLSCLGDFNGDGQINTADLLIMLSDFGCPSDCLADLNGDDAVDTSDLLIFLSAFGGVCSS